LIPCPEGAKSIVTVRLHTIKPPVIVRKIMLVGRIENREFFHQGQAREPLGSMGVRAVVLWGELVSVPASAGHLLMAHDRP
jgi:hypothetical protein